MKMIKSLIVGAALLVGINSEAATKTLLLGATTSVSNAITGPFKLTQVIITAPTTQAPIVGFFDTKNTDLIVSNSSYVSIVSSVTNYVTLWTNYYGATNQFTNIALIDITTTNAAATNLLSPTFIAITPTNTTTTYNNLNLNFNFGLMLTNQTSIAGAGNNTLTLQYTQ